MQAPGPQPPDPCNRNQLDPVTPDQITLVGASVRSAARSLGRRRNSPLLCDGVDLFGDQDTREMTGEMSVVDPRDLNWPGQISSQTEPADRIFVCVGEWPAMRKALKALETRFCVLPSMASWDRAVSADALAQAAKVSGMRIPETLPVCLSNQRTKEVSPSQDPRSEPKDEGWLLKTPASAGGLGVRWATPSILADPAVQLERQLGVRQRWIPGRVMGATLLHDGQQVALMGVCRSLFTRIGDHPFVYCGALGPVRQVNKSPLCGFEAAFDRAALCRAADSIAKRSGLRGLLNLDFIVDSQGQHWLLEVNPRWSASMELVERAWCGDREKPAPFESLLGLGIETALGKALPNEVTWGEENGERSVIGKPDRGLGGVAGWLKRVVFAKRRCVFRSSGLHEMIGAKGEICDYPDEGTVIPQGQPICSVIMTVDEQPGSLMEAAKTVRRVRDHFVATQASGS